MTISRFPMFDPPPPGRGDSPQSPLSGKPSDVSRIRHILFRVFQWMTESRFVKDSPTRVAWWQQRARELDPSAFSAWEKTIRTRIATELFPRTSSVSSSHSTPTAAELKAQERKLAIGFALKYVRDIPSWSSQDLEIALGEGFTELNKDEIKVLVMAIWGWQFCSLTTWDKASLMQHFEEQFPDAQDAYQNAAEAVKDLVMGKYDIWQSIDSFRTREAVDQVMTILSSCMQTSQRSTFIDFAREYLNDHPSSTISDLKDALVENFPDRDSKELSELARLLLSKKSVDSTDKMLLDTMLRASKRNRCITSVLDNYREYAWTKESLIRSIGEKFPENKEELPILVAAISAMRFGLAQSRKTEDIIGYLKREFPEIDNEDLLEEIAKKAVEDAGEFSHFMDAGEIPKKLQDDLLSLIEATL